MSSIPSFEVNFIKNPYSEIPILQFQKFPDVKVPCPTNYPEQKQLEKPQEFIKLNLIDPTGNCETIAKLTDIAYTFQISEKFILQARDTDILQQLLDMALICKHYAIQIGLMDLDESLSKAKKEIAIAENAERKTDELWERLQIKKGGFGIIEYCRYSSLDCKREDSLKKIVAGAFRAIETNYVPQEYKTKFYSSDLNLKFNSVVNSSLTSIEITGLFKLIGEGASAHILQRVHLIAGTLDVGKNSIIKIVKNGLMDSPRIDNEIEILNEISKNGSVLGVRSNVIDAGDGILGHMGDFYQMDLEQFLGNSSKAFKNYTPSKLLTTFEKIKLSYQLIHGLMFFHKLKISHGDIKTANIFLNFKSSSSSNDLQPFVFFADFGEAYIHQDNKPLSLKRNVTPLYRCASDLIEGRLIDKKSNNTLEYEIHEKACDVFATACVIYELFTQRQGPEIFPQGDSYPWMPYHMVTTEFDPELRPNLKQRLISGGASDELSNRLVSALRFSYTFRPLPGLLMDVIKTDLKTANPLEAKAIINLKL